MSFIDMAIGLHVEGGRCFIFANKEDLDVAKQSIENMAKKQNLHPNDFIEVRGNNLLFFKDHPELSEKIWLKNIYQSDFNGDLSFLREDQYERFFLCILQDPNYTEHIKKIIDFNISKPSYKILAQAARKPFERLGGVEDFGWILFGQNIKSSLDANLSHICTASQESSLTPELKIQARKEQASRIAHSYRIEISFSHKDSLSIVQSLQEKITSHGTSTAVPGFKIGAINKISEKNAQKQTAIIYVDDGLDLTEELVKKTVEAFSHQEGLSLRVTQGDSSTRDQYPAYFDETGRFNDDFYREALKDLDVERDKPFNESLIPAKMRSENPVIQNKSPSTRIINGEKKIIE